MIDRAEISNTGKDQPSEQIQISSSTRNTLSVCLVGGEQIIRVGIGLLLIDDGINITGSYEDQANLAEALGETEDPKWDAMVLILKSAGPFSDFHHLRNLLDKTGQTTPLVLLTDKVSRGQVYTALRKGAKAYVNMDASPSELTKAIRMVARDKTYLAPDAAELLANDISNTGPTAGGRRLPKMALSPREVEIVQLLCEGHICKEIARQLSISAKTVENHRHNIYRKCEVNNIARLVRHAIRQGMVSV